RCRHRQPNAEPEPEPDGDVRHDVAWQFYPDADDQLANDAGGRRYGAREHRPGPADRASVPAVFQTTASGPGRLERAHRGDVLRAPGDARLWRGTGVGRG